MAGCRVEQLQLRADTQCGCWKGRGKLDASFTLAQAINTALKHTVVSQEALVCCVYKYSGNLRHIKAFDTVHRGEEVTLEVRAKQ